MDRLITLLQFDLFKTGMARTVRNSSNDYIWSLVTLRNANQVRHLSRWKMLYIQLSGKGSEQ